MRSLLIVGFSILALNSSAYADATVYAFGIGQESCGKFLSDPSLSMYGESWILGYWTAANELNRNHMVGQTTDGDGIFYAVKKLCASDPTLKLMDAAGEVYNRLLSENH